MKFSYAHRWVAAAALVLTLAGGGGLAAEGGKPLNVLFIGNSFTARHNLSQVVKAMAEAGNPGLRFEPTTVIYGGRTMRDHWRLGSQNFVKIATLTAEEEAATIKSLKEQVAKDPKDKYAPAALSRHQELAKNLDAQRKKWDIVVLQSYRDDNDGEKSSYVEWVPKFAELAKAMGAQVIFYETTPVTQNEKPLTAAPDEGPVLAKEKVITAVAKKCGAKVVPMAMVAQHCQTVRPDLTLRFVNDSHLNQTMAYLTACTFYAVLFDRSPEGLPVASVTDIRTADGQKDKDRDGGPLTRTFADKDRADLQRIAWEGLKQFQKLGAQ